MARTERAAVIYTSGLATRLWYRDTFPTEHTFAWHLIKKRNWGHNVIDRTPVMWPCYSPGKHCLYPNSVGKSKSATFSVSPHNSIGSCLLLSPLFASGTLGLPVAALFLCIQPQSPELHKLKSSGVVWSDALVKRHETQRHSVDFSNAQQLVRGRARPQALPSAQCHLYPLSILPFAFSFTGFGLHGAP